MKTDLYDKTGEKIGNVEVPERLFGVPWNADLVHQALRVQTTNRRDNIAHAKDRGEVRGGGKKPWRQKGTGRARHGSIRSPLWVGGGRAHGPNKEKVYSLIIPQKMRQAAMFSIFSKRLTEGEIKVVDSLGITEPKTKLLRDALKGFAPKRTVLIIVSPENKAVFMASSNMDRVKVADPRSLNVYDLLKYGNVIIEQGALETIEKHYNGSKK